MEREARERVRLEEERQRRLDEETREQARRDREADQSSGREGRDELVAVHEPGLPDRNCGGADPDAGRRGNALNAGQRGDGSDAGSGSGAGSASGAAVGSGSGSARTRQTIGAIAVGAVAVGAGLYAFDTFSDSDSSASSEGSGSQASGSKGSDSGPESSQGAGSGAGSEGVSSGSRAAAVAPNSGSSAQAAAAAPGPSSQVAATAPGSRAAASNPGPWGAGVGPSPAANAGTGSIDPDLGSGSGLAPDLGSGRDSSDDSAAEITRAHDNARSPRSLGMYQPSAAVPTGAEPQFDPSGLMLPLMLSNLQDPGFTDFNPGTDREHRTDDYGRQPGSPPSTSRPAPQVISPPLAQQLPGETTGSDPGPQNDTKASQTVSPAPAGERVPDGDGRIPYTHTGDGVTERVWPSVARAYEAAYSDKGGTDGKAAYVGTEAEWPDTTALEPVDPNDLASGDLITFDDGAAVVRVQREEGDPEGGIVDVIIQGQLTPIADVMVDGAGELGAFAGFRRPPGIEPPGPAERSTAVGGLGPPGEDCG